jgi:hypothetical protein
MPTYLHNDDGISRYREQQQQPLFHHQQYSSQEQQVLNCRQIFDHVSDCPVCRKVFGMHPETEHHFVTMTPAKFFLVVAILIAIFVAVPAIVKRLVRRM